jgi:hypothetical protein
MPLNLRPKMAITAESSAKKEFECRVTDTGIGIAPET